MIKIKKRKSSSSLVSEESKKQPRMEAEDNTVFVPLEILTLIFSFLDPFFVADIVRLVCERWKISASANLKQFAKDNEHILCVMKTFFENTCSKQNKLLSIGFPVTTARCIRRELPTYTDYPDIFPSGGPSDDWERDVKTFWNEVFSVLRVHSWNSFPSLFLHLLRKCRYFRTITLNGHWYFKLARCRDNDETHRSFLKSFSMDRRRIKQEKLDKKNADKEKAGILVEHLHAMTATFPIDSIDLVPYISRFLWLPTESSPELICRLDGFSCTLSPNGKALLHVVSSRRDYCVEFCREFLEDLQKTESSKEEDLTDSTSSSLDFVPRMFTLFVEWTPISFDEMKRRSKKLLSVMFDDEIEGGVSSLIAFGLPWIENESESFIVDMVCDKVVYNILPRNPIYYLTAFKKRIGTWKEKRVWNLILYDALRILDLWPLLTTQKFSISRFKSYFSTEAIVSLIPQLVGCKNMAKKWKPFLDPWFKPLELPSILVQNKPEKLYSPPQLKYIIAKYMLTESEKNKEPFKPYRIKLKKSKIFCMCGPGSFKFTGGMSLDVYEDLLKIAKKTIE